MKEKTLNETCRKEYQIYYNRIHDTAKNLPLFFPVLELPARFPTLKWTASIHLCNQW